MLHEYKCKSGHKIEVDVRFGETPPELVTCNICQEDAQKIFSNVNIIFKGWGWTSTDNRKKRVDEIKDSKL